MFEERLDEQVQDDNLLHLHPSVILRRLTPNHKNRCSKPSERHVFVHVKEDVMVSCFPSGWEMGGRGVKDRGCRRGGGVGWCIEGYVWS